MMVINKKMTTMKKIKLLYIILACVITFISCKKDETRTIVSDNPTAPVFTNPVEGTSFVFSTANDSLKIVFRWSRADFGFQASLINTIQMAKKNDDSFKKMKQFFVKPSNDDSTSILNKELNKALLSAPLSLTANVSDTILVRVQSLLDKVDTVYSPVIKIIVKPYK
jgi:starch-binding outer membrane protein SusE/F